MRTWRDFFATWRWTLLFWERGKDYTIVTNRHIGLDVGRFSGVPEQVPALKSGTVVRVLWTKTMGMVVVLDVGAGRFHAYCHLSGAKLPARGQWIAQGARVGRLAEGPANVPTSDIEFPGTAWGGIHLHLVETNHPDAAYTFPRIKGSEFYNPADTIKQLLAGAADTGIARPFDPEEDDMPLTDQEKKDIAAAVWSFAIGEAGQSGVNNTEAWRRLGLAQFAAEEARRIGAPYAIYTYGSGLVALNKSTFRWMILAPGYAELLVHLGLAGPGSPRIDEGQFKYVTGYVPAATGFPDLSHAEGISDEDLAEIKKAIEENRVALSQEQYENLVAAVTRGARDGGEDGARKALEDLTLVVKTG